MKSLTRVILLTGLILTVFGFSVYGETVTAVPGVWTWDSGSCIFSAGCGMSDTCRTLDGTSCPSAGTNMPCCAKPKQFCNIDCASY